MPVDSIQYGQQPWHYANGLTLSNDATTPNTILDINSGSILDSTGVYQLMPTSAMTLSSAVSGLGGLDTGTLAASTVYAVYLVGDPVTLQPYGCIISLAYGVKTVSIPTLPFGYSAYALLGYVVTDSSKNFLKGYWKGGNSTQRMFIYDAPQAASVGSSGTSTTYAAVNLTGVAPLVNNLYATFAIVYTPGTASGHSLELQPGNATGDAVTIHAQVASIPFDANVQLLSQNTTISSVLSPTINYKVTSGDTLTSVAVAGFEFLI